MWDWTPASVPPPAQGRSRPTNTPVFAPSSFLLLSFAWFYIFFSAGQILLSALRWCSACPSVSEGVILMYPWREKYSISIYSSAIFSPNLNIFLIFCLQKKQIFNAFLWKKWWFFKLLLNRKIQNEPDKYWIIQSYYVFFLYPRLWCFNVIYAWEI